MSSFYSTVGYKHFEEDVNKNALSGTILTSDKRQRSLFLIRPYVQLKSQTSGYFLSKTNIENGAGAPKKGFWRQFMDNDKKKYNRSDTGIAEFHSNQ